MMRPLVKTVLAGALLGAAPYLFLSLLFGLIGIPAAIRDRDSFGPFVIAALPLMVSVSVTLLGVLLIGLPVTALLKRYHRESAGAYLASGTIGGAALTALLLAVIDAHDAEWLVPFGALAGAGSGLTWWRSARRPEAR